MKMKRITLTLTVLVSMLIAITLLGSGQPMISTALGTYLDMARSQYPGIVGSRIDNCKLCHVSPAGGGLPNNYGWDWSDAGRDPAAFALIEGMDSDEDGILNIDEITDLYYPGDASDFPVYTPTPTATASATPTNTPTRTRTPTVPPPPPDTPTPTVSPTQTNTPTITNTPTDTATPTITPTSTNTPLVTDTSTPTATRTPTMSPTPTGPIPPYTGQAHGVVRLEGRSDHRGAIVSIAGRYAITDASGQFAIDSIPVGTWSAVAERQGYLSALRSGVVILSGHDALLPDLTLHSGDVNSDCGVNLFDLVIVSVVYNPSGPVLDPRADINADGVVDLFDLVLVTINYGLNCPQIW